MTLSSREIEILNRVSQGLTTNEIADLLYISPHTVLSHRRNLLEKLDARNTAGLVRRGFECGMLKLDQGVSNYRLG